MTSLINKFLNYLDNYPIRHKTASAFYQQSIQGIKQPAIKQPRSGLNSFKKLKKCKNYACWLVDGL